MCCSARSTIGTVSTLHRITIKQHTARSSFGPVFFLEILEANFCIYSHSQTENNTIQLFLIWSNTSTISQFSLQFTIELLWFETPEYALFPRQIISHYVHPSFIVMFQSEFIGIFSFYFFGKSIAFPKIPFNYSNMCAPIFDDEHGKSENALSTHTIRTKFDTIWLFNEQLSPLLIGYKVFNIVKRRRMANSPAKTNKFQCRLQRMDCSDFWLRLNSFSLLFFSFLFISFFFCSTIDSFYRDAHHFQLNVH